MQRQREPGKFRKLQAFWKTVKEVRWSYLDPVTLTNPWKDFIYWKGRLYREW